MATKRYALKTEADIITEPEYTAPEIARVNRIIDSQLGGTLEALGVGIIFGVLSWIVLDLAAATREC